MRYENFYACVIITDDEATWSWLALDVIQVTVRVGVTSLHGSLSTFWLCVMKAGFKHIQTWNSYIFLGSGPLQWVRIVDDDDGLSNDQQIYILISAR